MLYVLNKRQHLYQFDSLSEMTAWIEATPRTAWHGKNSSERTGSDRSWDLGVGYRGAMKLASDGWMEGAKRAQEALDVFPPKDAAPDTRNDFYGHLPHVARYCAGAPDSMIRYAKEADKGMGRIITLYVSISTGAMSDADCMANYGVGVAQYINQIEASGKRVELYIGFYSDDYGNGEAMGISVRVKNADQPIDLAVLSFALGHPGMFRRIMFAAMERTSVKPKPFGYGVPTVWNAKQVIDAPQGAYFLNGMKEVNRNASTPEDALAHIGEQIERAMAQEQE